ncbi:adhesion G-protein coupled receptor F3 isoform X2 [Anabas testudineus]|uniref:adhesion G-protein coupled receptor F3 isoform X2 n=1 Tax=Anabas testudineus TaxID=64144 RepID=UPI000E4650C7|nr:adhesion G-protein coupled receptor F3 isoform X2 [Anabas testudineus]
MENRIRMQIFIFFYILGLNIFQASGDNSTQMQYFTVTIEKNAFNNITAILTRFDMDDLVVDRINMTTNCTQVGITTMCTCLPGYKWSDKVCQSSHSCCDNSCNFTNKAPMCIANSTVNIKGSISLSSLDYQNCLADTSTPQYKSCNEALKLKLQRVYSTLRGFDALHITKYSVGSVIAAFDIIISAISTQDLFNKSQALTKDLNATLNMQTTGVVQMSIPSYSVCYTSQHTVTCTSEDDLGVNPIWKLKRQNVEYDITNGTEAQVTSQPRITKVDLKRITELWEGEYTCSYKIQSDSLTITHKASAVLDVALLPKTDISTSPQFPYCTKNSDLLTVKLSCKIAPNNDSYNVTWDKKDIIAAIIPETYSTGQTDFSATTVVSCNSKDTAEVTCIFKNTCNNDLTSTQEQQQNTSTTINIIPVGGTHCNSDGVWKETKAGYTAVIQCSGAAGQILRPCSILGVWEQEDSQCVNQNLYNVLQKAIIVDIGLGSLDGNAATVFSQLQGATNNSRTINSFANINTSVQVLVSLSGKLQEISNTSTVNDFLTSSSNLLDRSLNNSWTNYKNNNQTLAETYLDSVERLIYMSNLTSESKKTNIAVGTCNEKGCNNTVFNVNVTLEGSNTGIVKTTGFQQLQDYLPHSDNNSQPNSIVVSITTENKQNSVMITIDFPLLSPRPRNVQMQCVAWDNNTHSWSQNGCEWQGANNLGRCICNHLSSFAILMSRYPLQIDGETEITYTGLCVSIISLLISLVIEMTVWSAVVKTNTLYLRHTAHINISLCLIIADCCFLASSIDKIPEIWCQTFVVLKHFCYLAMFFWMLCLSSTLLHQAVFLFHNVSKKNYLRFSLVLGYVCPFLIVFITFLTNNSGAEGSYYNRDGCWLVYNGLLQGSIFTFILPIGIIIFINVFSMLVVIMKLLDHPKSTDKSLEKEKGAAKTVLRTVILLTPIFGITWSLGFAVMILDLTSGNIVFIVNYAFILLNAFQGLFILLTTCLGDKMVREAVLNRLRKKTSASMSESSSKLDSSWKK